MSHISAMKVQPTGKPADQKIDALYHTALKAHQGGDFKTAREHYHRVLDLHPAHVKTLYLLGSLCCQTGEFAQGIEYLDKAIALSPDHAEAYSSRGNALNQLQQFDEALACYAKATSINPEYAEAYHNQGITLVNLKRYREAIASYEEAIRLNASHAMAYFEKGNVELTLNFYQNAIKSFKQAIVLAPTFAQASVHLAYAEKALSQHNGSSIDSADLSTQKLSELLSNGEKLEKLNLKGLALSHYQEAVRRFPDAVKAHLCLGMLLKLENCAAEALTCFNTAIKLNPKSALAYQKRGELYTRISRSHDAIADYEAALAIDGDLYQYYYAMAFVYRCLGQFDDALECYRLWIRLGSHKRSKQDQAIADFSESIIWLLKGHYLLGWQLYEGRWLAVAERHFRHFKQPLWSGEDIAEKHILLHAEQGFGDTIQMFRYVELVAKKAKKVTLEVNSPLLRLLKHNTQVDVISKEHALPDFDVQCPLMSLPLAFKTTVKTVPAIHLIQADKEVSAIWKQKVQAKISPEHAKNIKVGFVATGNMKHSGDIARSLNFQQVVDFLAGPFNLFCLQREFRPEDAKFLDNNKHIHYFGKQLQDFADTAGLIAAMDLVITVDTSVAHLAASMGKPTWILLPFSSDFRWLLDREDSPWYASARLYRQSTEGDWDAVLNKVKTELALFSQARQA